MQHPIPQKIMIPYHRNPNFTGRIQYLKELRENFLSGKSVAKTQIITGIGGIGKTQITLEYINQYDYVYKLICWIKAENEISLLDDYHRFATEQSLIDPIIDDDTQIIKAVHHWMEQNTDWLFIFDDTQDPDSIGKFLPQNVTGHVLITSRNKNWGAFGRVIEVDRFSTEEAAEFLLKRVKNSHDQDVIELIEELERLPLALELAGAYMTENNMFFMEYLTLFYRYKLKLFQEEILPQDYSKAVATTCYLSLKKISGEASRQLIYLSAFMNPGQIQKKIFMHGSEYLPNPLAEIAGDEFVFNKTITELERYSLIQDLNNDLWSMHRLTQEVIRRFLSTDADGWIYLLIKLFYNTFSLNQDKLEIWADCPIYIYHILALNEHAKNYKDDEQLSWLLNETANYLCQFAGYKETELLLQRDLEIRENVFGLESPETATALNNLAKFYYNQGRYETTGPLFQRALAISEKASGPEYPATSTFLNNLAVFYRSQGNYESAEQLHRRALEIREKIFGPEHYDTATSLNNLAFLYKNQGKYELAEPLFHQAFELYEKVLGPEHPDTAESLNNLASLYYDQGRFEEAEPLFRKALQIKEHTLGKEHPYTAASLNNLAALYKCQQRIKEAESLYRRALEIQEKVLGSKHPDTATTLNNLAFLYFNQGNYEAAELLYQRALAIREKTLGLKHSDTATSLNNLAYLYFSQGRNEDAEPLYQKALEICENALGPEHPNTKTILNNLKKLKKDKKQIKD